MTVQQPEELVQQVKDFLAFLFLVDSGVGELAAVGQG